MTTTNTRVSALQEAVDQFPSKAAFIRALRKVSNRPTMEPAILQHWLKRNGGAPCEICPYIEEISGVRVERLFPDTNWAVIRGSRRPAAKIRASANSTNSALQAAF